jgi:signal transduction histidine kinase
MLLTTSSRQCGIGGDIICAANGLAMRNDGRSREQPDDELDAAYEIARLRSELKLANAALVTSQEMDRKRMASELHDSIGQSLNAISFGIGVALDQLHKSESDQAIAMMESLRTQVRLLLDEVRRIALDLRPAMLDDLGIVGTLSWFFRQFRSVYPGVNLVTVIEANEDQVPESLRTPIYRVIQEASSNVLKHSGASEFYVALRHAPRRIELMVRDNGRGFAAHHDPLTTSASRSGIGLAGMRNRVEFSGGEFFLQSSPGTGTQIRAIWAIHAAVAGN